ncbi:MAG: helix-turn-helix domain-containing protein, partial [Stutzerimonas stutzeri]
MNSPIQKPATSRVWRWRHAVASSDLPPTTRHVLATLGNKMDRDGGSCFPTIADLCVLTGLTQKTVRTHLKIASDRGWLVVRSGLFSGQKWRRNDYRARWPDPVAAGADAGEKRPDAEAANDGPDEQEVCNMTPKREGIDAPKVGEPLPQDNNSPRISPDSAGARADGEKRRRLEASFLRWLPGWPGYDSYSPHKARREWFGLTDEQRAACIAGTPGWLQWTKGKPRVRSPAEYLRIRAWEKVPVSNRVHAPYCGKLWMAHRLAILLRPATGNLVLTAFDRMQISSGAITHDALMRQKRRALGWPDANAMVAAFRAKKKFFVGPLLYDIAATFRQVERGGALFHAWERLHERRDWPFLDQPN